MREQGKPARKPKKLKVRRPRGDVFQLLLDGEKDVTVRKGHGAERMVVTIREAKEKA